MANSSAYKEFNQIQKHQTFELTDPKKLTRMESAQVLRSIVFTKTKDGGECKTRTVADDSQQNITISDEDKASPTVSCC